jgi:hypothetical protein
MITRRLSVFREPSFLSLVDLFRQADVGYTNLEMLIHEYEHPPGSAGGTYTASEPLNLEELKWAGPTQHRPERGPTADGAPAVPVRADGCEIVGAPDPIGVSAQLPIGLAIAVEL